MQNKLLQIHYDQNLVMISNVYSGLQNYIRQDDELVTSNFHFQELSRKERWDEKC